MITEIKSMSNLIEILESDKKIVVDYYAPWCTPCKHLLPIINKLSEINNDMLFIKLNVDNEEFSKLLDHINITGIPCIHFIYKKSIKNKVVGFNKDKINELTEEFKNKEDIGELMNLADFIDKISKENLEK